MPTKIVEALANLSGLGGSLARSAAALLEAEVEQLRFDLARNWARFLRLVLLAAFVFGAVFWALGALLFAAGAGLASVLPVWAAALAVAGGLLVVAFILIRVLQARARRLESPVGTVRRRVGSHLAFWRGVLEDEGGDDAPGGTS
ncbi:MAG: phage holin family protein [Acidobacteriota bacterium]|nr:phage holin family protein [Acidobacteriota bacterium]MDE3265626.1 phage holin family protein [Acidobacteriota bacterium]